jgi:hypothetical protein
MPTTYLDYFVFPYLKNNVFKNRPGTIPESIQVITDNCNLIDVPTLERSFENWSLDGYSLVSIYKQVACSPLNKGPGVLNLIVSFH